MTRQEVILWMRLREMREQGFHFRRQSPIADYIVDFECRRQRLIVEVDGLGYRVLRFGNSEINQNMEGVLEAIRLALIADANELQDRVQSLP